MTTSASTLSSPLSDPGIVQNPYPTYERLAGTEPVHWWADMGAWAVLRYADCKGAFQNPALSAERMGTVLGVKFPSDHLPDDSIYFRFVNNVMMYTDNPLHATLRKAVNAGFSREAHEHYETAIRAAALELVDPLGAGPADIDAVTGLALRLPTICATRVFGVPLEDIDFVVPRVATIMSYWSGPRQQPIPLAEVLDDLDELHDYAVGLVRGERGTVPSGTAISRLMETPPDIPIEQVVHQLVLVFIALFAPTTPGSISSGLLSFARNPEQIAKFRRNPDGAEAAANEIFRYNASNQFTWRLAKEPTKIGDVQVQAGDVVTLIIGSANHDAAVFDRPHEFVIDRPNSAEGLTFGVGGHSCLGSRIAHCQVKSLISALLSRFETIELTGEPVWNPNLEFRSLRSLPLRFA